MAGLLVLVVCVNCFLVGGLLVMVRRFARRLADLEGVSAQVAGDMTSLAGIVQVLEHDFYLEHESCKPGGE